MCQLQYIAIPRSLCECILPACTQCWSMGQYHFYWQATNRSQSTQITVVFKPFFWNRIVGLFRRSPTIRMFDSACFPSVYGAGFGFIILSYFTTESLHKEEFFGCGQESEEKSTDCRLHRDGGGSGGAAYAVGL